MMMMIIIIIITIIILIPLLTFSFDIIFWTDTDIKQIYRKTHKLLTNARVHHPKAAIERLILLRTYRLRGLIDISNLLNKQKTILKEYFIEKIHLYYIMQ